jgi:DegV family protein with EDD domain
MTIRIATDSTCDLPQDVIRELKIAVVPLYINIGDQGYLDGVDISRRSFYNNLPDYATHPTTGVPGPDAFSQAYDELARDGATEILSLHISKALSAMIDVAKIAAASFQKAAVTAVDGGQLSLGTGFQVETAARMALEGKSMAEILAKLENMADRLFVTARLDTLEFLRRSGRMNGAVSGIGSLLRLKPLLKMINGVSSSEMVRTTKKAEERLVQLLKERLPVERFALVHTNAAEAAEAFRVRIADLIPKEQVYSMDITPVIGAHIGPGAVGYAILSKEPKGKQA